MCLLEAILSNSCSSELTLCHCKTVMLYSQLYSLNFESKICSHSRYKPVTSQFSMESSHPSECKNGIPVSDRYRFITFPFLVRPSTFVPLHISYSLRAKLCLLFFNKTSREVQVRKLVFYRTIKILYVLM